MAKAKAAWGIEVGNAAIKAIRLERDGSDIRVADFVVIPHPKVLTTPDLNIEEMLRISLGAFMTQKTLEGAVALIGVPGSDSLARFAKLPPIHKKAVPQTVMFEAKQQIPFPLEEVEWDYHLFASDDSPELEVGIFAVLKEKIAQRLGLYKELGLTPTALTLCPLAVYNTMIFDRDLDKPGQPTLGFLDIGTRSSDLVVIADGHCWIRTFPIGGHHFTEAIASAFSVPYGKADRLKAEAATHKYAKQLMHAMRPVFDDLLQEVQRSIGHFQSLRPDRPITRIVGLGSTFRIPGLRKFLSDQLNVEIRRQEEYEKIRVEGSAAADFSANAMNLATAIGLALQGLGYAEIGINLSPVENMREQVWRTKSKWFAAAAVLTVAASGLMFWRPGGHVRDDVPAIVRTAKADGDDAKRKFDEAKAAADLGARANNMVFLLEDREVWPWIVNDVYTAMGTAGTQAELLNAFDPKNPPLPYDQWKLIELDSLTGRYMLDKTDAAKPARVIEVTVRMSVPRPKSGANDARSFIQGSVLKWLNDNKDRKEAPYTIIIPEKGILPEFGDRSASGAQDNPSGAAGYGTGGGATDVDQAQDSGASQDTGVGGKAMTGRNKTNETFSAPGGGILGGSNTGMADAPPAGSKSDAVGGSKGGTKPRTRPATTPGTHSDPVDLDKDAPIPSKPDLYAGRPATSVKITFKIKLRDPVGRPVTGTTQEGGADAAAAQGGQQ